MAEYTLQHTAVEVDNAVGKALSIEANPTLAGTESALIGLQVGDTKYKVDSGISQADADARYLQLTGGTINGKLKVVDSLSVGQTNSIVWTSPTTSTSYTILEGDGINSVQLGNSQTNAIYIKGSASHSITHQKGSNFYEVLDTSNGLALAGGTMTGDIIMADTKKIKVKSYGHERDILTCNYSGVQLGDGSAPAQINTNNTSVYHQQNGSSYVMLDTYNTQANPGNTTATLTSLKLNGTNYALAGGTQVTFVDWS